MLKGHPIDMTSLTHPFVSKLKHLPPKRSTRESGPHSPWWMMTCQKSKPIIMIPRRHHCSFQHIDAGKRRNPSSSLPMNCGKGFLLFHNHSIFFFSFKVWFELSCRQNFVTWLVRRNHNIFRYFRYSIISN